jgi:hypothetical protein
MDRNSIEILNDVPFAGVFESSWLVSRTLVSLVDCLPIFTGSLVSDLFLLESIGSENTTFLGT